MDHPPAQEGLHGIFLHQVRVDGTQLDEPFKGQVGLASLNPAAIEATPGTNSATVTLNSQIELDELVADGFGLSQPATTSKHIAASPASEVRCIGPRRAGADRLAAPRIAARCAAVGCGRVAGCGSSRNNRRCMAA